MIKSSNLVKTKWGFLEFEDIPSDKELSDFYSQKYYQEEHGLYKRKYSELEQKHTDFVNSLISRKVQQLKVSAKSFVDVGCGEGHLLKEFKRCGFEVKGFDFSSDGISGFYPELMEFFVSGNIYETVKNEFGNVKYDVISLITVLEHVSDAVKTVELLKSGMKKDSILVIKVPNDFCELHEKLIREKFIDREGWVSYPEHLRYFNKDNLVNFLNDMGLDILSMLADYSREIFLLNDELNYYNNPKKGATVYKQNMQTDLFLSELDKDKVIKLYEAYADLGIGRSITCFCRLKG